MQPRRRRSVSLLLTSILALTVLGSPATSAQDSALADAFCASMSVDEVGTALGATVAAEPGFEGCTWASDGSDGTYAYLSANWAGGPFESNTVAFPGGTSLTVAGRPAYLVGDSTLFVQLDQGVLMLFMGAAADVDPQAAIEGLATLIVSRAGTLPPPPPPPTQAPVPHADPDLEALFPATVGGQPLTVQSQDASQTVTSGSEGTEELLAQLAADGKTIEDVTVATAYTADMSASIFAIRVAGADAAKYAPLLVASMSADAQQAPGQVGGKDVTVVTAGSNSQYFYPRNDILWVVIAAEPALSEIFAALP